MAQGVREKEKRIPAILKLSPKMFEKEFAEKVGIAYAVAVSSG